MNRAKRRQLDRVIQKVDHPGKYNLSDYQIQQIKAKATQEAVDTIERNLIKVMFSIPIAIMHWDYGWGQKRCERLADRICEEYIDKFKQGIMTADDYAELVGDLTGVKFEV